MIFGQRETSWKDIPLGFGNGTIGEVGCNLCSFTMCLYDKGYTDVNPQNVNQALKDKQAFASLNLLSWDKLNLAYPQVKYIGSFNYPTVAAPLDVLQDYLNKGYSVIIKINGAAIGGRGDHFVKAERVESGNVIVKDPWYKKEATITSLFTLDWADTAPEIITGYRVMEITPKPGVVIGTDEMIIKKDTFNSLTQFSEKWKDICLRFGSNPDNTSGLDLFTRYDQTNKTLDDANKNYEILKKAKEEVDGLLKIAGTTSEERKRIYDDLIAWEANKLGCSSEEAVIRGEIASLIDVESKLVIAERTIKELNETHEQEKIAWQKRITDLEKDIEIWKDKATGFSQEIEKIKKEMEQGQQAVEKVNFIKKIIDDIVALFTKRKVQKDAQKLKEVQNDGKTQG